MYRNYLCVEVVILLLLSHVGWNGPSSPRVQPCSRSQSRVARQLVRRKLTGVLQRYRVPMSPDCPFHPSRDLYWWPQGPAAGSVGSASPGWKCPMCGRGFFCEDKLTSHWDQEHAPDLPKVDNGVCLADYCDILRCDVLGHKLAVSEVAPPPRQQARTDPKCVGSTPTDDPRCSCDEKHMLALQQKCRIVVQQCVIGLLSILSVKDFQDIEEELNNGICSYLTCNKYWDDTLIEPWAKPPTTPANTVPADGDVGTPASAKYFVVHSFLPGNPSHGTDHRISYSNSSTMHNKLRCSHVLRSLYIRWLWHNSDSNVCMATVSS
ncbi:uncharacterized protein ISCGN_000511 [Ixodes scapularis]